MALQQNTSRILTTHVGSLPRPKKWLDSMKAQLSGSPGDRDGYEQQLREVVRECVAQQAECGIDILTDGEQSKPGFFTYTRERLEGFEPRPDYPRPRYNAEVAAFPE
jgi:5-methyltetrahydropteroyltriglutamate--homocysteine methyltransferase